LTADHDGRVVVLAALERELAPLRLGLLRSRATLVRTGVGPRLAAAATRQHAAGTRLLVNTGCCGGLTAGLRPGTLVIADRVLEDPGPGRSLLEASSPDPSWVSRTLAAGRSLGLTCVSGPTLTVRRALFTPEEKRRGHERSGALAVDMETAAVARAAARAGVPYLTVRVVLDAADESLPLSPRLLEGLVALGRGKLLLDAFRPGRAWASLRLSMRLVLASRGLARLLAEVL